MKDVDGTPRYHCVVVARDISGEEKKCPCIEYSNNGQDNKCEVCQHLAVFHAPKKVTPVWLMYICLSNVPYVYVWNVMFKEEKKIGDMSVQQLRVNTYLVNIVFNRESNYISC